MNLTKLFGKNYYRQETISSGKVMKNYYFYIFICDNCGKKVEVYIKKGITIKIIRGSIVCGHCGCHLEKIK